MDSEKAKELRVIALFDGRPGHEKQTMGIVQALQAKVPVQVIRINVKKFSLIEEVVQTCRVFLPLAGLSHEHIEGGDVLIGTGSRTHLPMLLYKKKYAIPAVTCMTPASHLRNRFDLCFVPEHDGVVETRNINLTIGAPNCSQNKRKHQKECGLILLGGVDIKSHHWESRQMAEMVEEIVKREAQIHWSVSSSPRTPQDTIVMIKKLVDVYDNINFFDYQNTLPGWIEEQYDKSDVVWVSADSISMVYEAITAGCNVGIFPVRWIRENSKFQRNEKILFEKKLVMSFKAWERGDIAQNEKIELSEAQRCADLILKKWWFKNLQ